MKTKQILLGLIAVLGAGLALLARWRDIEKIALTGAQASLKGFIAVLLLSGCTIGLTSPFVAPIVLLLILGSASVRAKSWPFIIVGIVTGGMVLASYRFVFGSLDLASSPTTSDEIKIENIKFKEGFLPLAALCFAIMGILLGVIICSQMPEPRWTVAIAKVVLGSLLLSFVLGHLLLGMLSLVLVILIQRPGSLGGAIWLITLLYYPAGGFLIPAFTSSLTGLSLGVFRHRIEFKGHSCK